MDKDKNLSVANAAASGPHVADEETLRTVAVAAFAMFRASQAAVRAPEPLSAWGTVARVQALRDPLR